MGHQDMGLELRSLHLAAEAAAEAAEPTAKSAEPVVEASPLAMDHDEIDAWRKTARYLRGAA